MATGLSVNHTFFFLKINGNESIFILFLDLAGIKLKLQKIRLKVAFERIANIVLGGGASSAPHRSEVRLTKGDLIYVRLIRSIVKEVSCANRR